MIVGGVQKTVVCFLISGVMMLSIEKIEEIGQEVIRLGDRYQKRITENDANLLLFGYLTAWAKVQVDREHHIQIAGSINRFDFRYGGSNPDLEFALRHKSRGGELYGSQNKSELRKLTRISK